MVFRRDRVKPTAYPFLPFHITRSAQLLSSLVVASIMFYFLSSLSSSRHKLPWTFILLLSVSLLTIIALTATIVLHFLHGLNPTLNLSLNSLLAILWTISFALLSWWSSSTLSHVCNQDNWDNDAGIAVCRMYKALFSFSLLGLVATLVAVGLDVKVRRGVEGRGRFAAIGLIGGGGKSRVLGDGHMDEHTDEHENNPNPTAAGRQARGGEGYALPDEQFGYGDNDTGYHGAAGQIGRRSEEHWI